MWHTTYEVTYGEHINQIYNKIDYPRSQCKEYDIWLTNAIPMTRINRRYIDLTKKLHFFFAKRKERRFGGDREICHFDLLASVDGLTLNDSLNAIQSDEIPNYCHLLVCCYPHHSNTICIG